jgi:signal transduction histidine kinase
MKLTKTPLLFFYVFLPLFVMVNLQVGFAQHQSDSLAYYSQLALKPQSPDDLDAAYRYFKSNHTEAMAQVDYPKALHDLYYIASIDYKKGAYETSEDAAVEAIALLDDHLELPNQVGLRKSFYTLLAILYYEQRNKEKSFELYSKVLEITDKAKDSAIVYNNISNVYKNNSEDTKALEGLIKAYGIVPRLQDTLTIGLIFDNLGFAYAKQGKSQEGFDLMQKALQLRTAVQDTSTLYRSYAHLADYYYTLDSLDAAKAHALKALDFAKSINSTSYLRDALGMLTTLSADGYATAYKRLNDSLYTVEKERINTNALMKYDYSEYQRKALESALETQQQEYKTMAAISIAAFIGLLSVFLYVILKSRHKKEKLQQVYTTEARISKKVHDEVANDVYQVMTKLQGQSDTNEAVLDDLEGIYIRTRDISKENSSIDVKAHYDTLIHDLLLSYKTEAVNVITRNSSKIDWEVLTDIKKITLYRVLQELMTNMRKHSKASIVVLSFNQSHKTISITYKDNGLGATLIKRNGLQNAENRINAIHGTLTFESERNKGFTAQIRI